MTVKELIAELEKMPPDMMVAALDTNFGEVGWRYVDSIDIELSAYSEFSDWSGRQDVVKVRT